METLFKEGQIVKCVSIKETYIIENPVIGDKYKIISIGKSLLKSYGIRVINLRTKRSMSFMAEDFELVPKLNTNNIKA